MICKTFSDVGDIYSFMQECTCNFKIVHVLNV